MQIHLHCPRCACHFSAPADTPASEVLDRMNDDAPWFALAEGDTFAEMVFAALASRGKILCPECRGEILVGGDNLGRFADGDSPREPSAPPAPRGPEGRPECG
jgi:hypothetical protein